MGGFANGLRDLLTVLDVERATGVGHSPDEDSWRELLLAGGSVVPGPGANGTDAAATG